MNSDMMRDIGKEIQRMVAVQDIRDICAGHCGDSVEVPVPGNLRMHLSFQELLPILDARIAASKDRLRKLGFVAPAHAADTARIVGG